MQKTVKLCRGRIIQVHYSPLSPGSQQSNSVFINACFLLKYQLKNDSIFMSFLLSPMQLLINMSYFLLHRHTAGWFPFRRQDQAQGPVHQQPPEGQRNQQHDDRHPNLVRTHLLLYMSSSRPLPVDHSRRSLLNNSRENIPSPPLSNHNAPFPGGRCR